MQEFMRGSFNTCRGSVLILTMWVLLFLSILAVVSGSIVRQEITAIEKIEDRFKLYDAASSGIMVAIDLVNASKSGEAARNQNICALSDPYFNNELFFKDVKIGSGTFTVSALSRDSISGESETRYGVIDEERKINVNYASQEILENLFMVIAGVQGERVKQLADAIIDWRDADDVMSAGGEGLSESVDYANAGYAYPVKSANFRSVEELLLVKEMTTDIFFKIRDHVTVFGSGKVNINTASRDVLLALGLPQDVVEKIVYFRAGLDMKEGTADDNIFASTKNIADTMMKTVAVARSDREWLSSVISKDLIDVDSTTFSALSTARLANTEAGRRVICVFNMNGTVEYWGFN